MDHGDVNIIMNNGTLTPYDSKVGNAYTVCTMGGEQGPFTITANTITGMVFDRWMVAHDPSGVPYEIADATSSTTTISITPPEQGTGQLQIAATYIEETKYLTLAGLDTYTGLMKGYVNKKVKTITDSEVTLVDLEPQPYLVGVESTDLYYDGEEGEAYITLPEGTLLNVTKATVTLPDTTEVEKTFFTVSTHQGEDTANPDYMQFIVTGSSTSEEGMIKWYDLDNMGSGPIVIPPEYGNLVEIVIYNPPDKTTYQEGESLNTEGLVVLAEFDSGHRVDVTKNCHIYVDDPLMVSDTSVDVSYEYNEVRYDTYFSIRVFGVHPQIPNNVVGLYHLDGNYINSITGVDDTAGFRSSYYIGEWAIGKFKKGLINVYSSGNVGDCAAPNIRFKSWGKTANEWANASTFTISWWAKYAYQKVASGSDQYKDTPMILFTFAAANNDTNNYPYQTNTTYYNCHATIFGYNYKQSTFGISHNNGRNFVYATMPTGFSLSTWHHYAIVIEGNDIKFFLDGVRLIETNLWIPSDTTVVYPTLAMHGNATSTDSYRNLLGGYIDEIMIANDTIYYDDFEPPTNSFGEDKLLSELKVVKLPDKIIYSPGEQFDLTGAIVEAYYTDGTYRDVTQYAEIVTEPTITVTTEFIELSYTEENITKTVFINTTALEDGEIEVRNVATGVTKQSIKSILYSDTDIQAGVTDLEDGQLYLVYE